MVEKKQLNTQIHNNERERLTKLSEIKNEKFSDGGCGTRKLAASAVTAGFAQKVSFDL